MSFSPLLDALIESLRVLPGVGTKTAQRMALHLLERNRSGGENLAFMIKKALDNIGHCEQCRTFSEAPVCQICNNMERDRSLLCVVESPQDLMAIEQTQVFKGYYFVLLGRLSPIEAMGPKDIGLSTLEKRFQSGEIQELIVATNSTVEGEATGYYIAQMAKPYQIRTSRIAHGVPLGSELENTDGGTLIRALLGRTEMEGE